MLIVLCVVVFVVGEWLEVDSGLMFGIVYGIDIRSYLSYLFIYNFD